MRFWLLGLSLLGLVACESRMDLAPVSERTWQERHGQQGMHRVRPGETLYSVAFHYDLDYRQLASYNRLYPPYSIRAGQILYLAPVVRRQAPSPRSMPVRTVRPKAVAVRGVVSGTPHFIWPAKGRIVYGFSPYRGRKGIDISGRQGEQVHAAAPGIVAYSGNGLMGYGNLIIIKHNEQYLTAYGNNARNWVKEGQHVSAGQVIGEMGRLERQFWGVHFEIRHAGKPVNPLIYLRHR